MAKKNKKKTSNQLKALRELHNIVISWTDKDFDEKGPFSDYCFSQRKKNKKLDQLLKDADFDNLSMGSFTNYLEDNSFQSESDDDENDINYEKKPKTKKSIKKKQKTNVKKPLTAFNFFCKEKGAELRKKNPSLIGHDFWAALSIEWKKLNVNEKNKYVKFAEKDKKRYQKESNKENKNKKKEKPKGKKSK